MTTSAVVDIDKVTTNLTELKTLLETQDDDICIFNRPERGLYSTKKISKGDIVIKVKRQYLLEYNYICRLYADHPSFENFQTDFVDKLLEVNSLVAYYLYKLKYKHIDSDVSQDATLSTVEDSMETVEVVDSCSCCCAGDDHRRKLWLSYIDNLPGVSEYINYWPEDDAQLINDGTTIGYLYNDFYRRLQQDAFLIYSYFHVDRTISFDTFYDGYLPLRLLVGSRIFGYICEGVPQSGIVPYVDMTNHALKHNTRWHFSDEIDCFVLQATCDISENSEILEYYGHHCNSDLLLYYGFTIKSNPHVKIIIDMASSSHTSTNRSSSPSSSSLLTSIFMANNCIMSNHSDYDCSNSISSSRIEINHDTTAAELQLMHRSNYSAIYTALLRLYNKRLVDVSRVKIQSNTNIMNIYRDEIRLLAHILDLDYN